MVRSTAFAFNALRRWFVLHLPCSKGVGDPARRTSLTKVRGSLLHIYFIQSLMHWRNSTLRVWCSTWLRFLFFSNIIYLDPSSVSMCSSVGHLTQHSDANAYTFSLNTFSDAAMRFLQILVAHESFIQTLLCKSTPQWQLSLSFHHPLPPPRPPWANLSGHTLLLRCWSTIVPLYSKWSTWTRARCHSWYTWKYDIRVPAWLKPYHPSATFERGDSLMRRLQRKNQPCPPSM